MKPILETTPQGKLLVRIDASHFAESSCSRLSWWALVMGLRKPGKDHKMEYGTAFHKALQHYYTTSDETASINLAVDYYTQPTIIVPEKDWRTVSHLADTLQQYFGEWRNDGLKPIINNGTPLLEQRFAYPLLATPVVDVLLCGTIDMLATYGGHRVIVDHKTTALTDVESYLDSYTMSPQLMIYTWVYQRLFPHLTPCYAMINGIFLSRTGKPRFKRSELLNFSDSKLRNIETSLMAKARELASGLEDYRNHGMVNFPPNYTCCERKYGMCRYTPLCRLDDDNLRDNIAAMDYTQRVYDPLRFQE